LGFWHLMVRTRIVKTRVNFLNKDLFCFGISYTFLSESPKSHSNKVAKWWKLVEETWNRFLPYCWYLLFIQNSKEKKMKNFNTNIIHSNIMNQVFRHARKIAEAHFFCNLSIVLGSISTFHFPHFLSEINS